MMGCWLCSPWTWKQVSALSAKSWKAVDCSSTSAGAGARALFRAASRLTCNLPLVRNCRCEAWLLAALLLKISELETMCFGCFTSILSPSFNFCSRLPAASPAESPLRPQSYSETYRKSGRVLSTDKESQLDVAQVKLGQGVTAPQPGL